MKSLSKLHAEAIIKAKTENEKVKAAAVAMIETPMELIRAILLKHEQAVIEVMRELHEAKEAAVLAEREACAKLCETDGMVKGGEVFAARIRARGSHA